MATDRQIRRAHLRIFTVPGYGQIEFAGVAPTGAVRAYKPGDRARGFGTFCLSSEAGEHVLREIGTRFATAAERRRSEQVSA